MVRILKRLLRFFRSILIAVLAVLPLAIAGTAYTNWDYLSREGIGVWRDYFSRKTANEAPPPAEWGHETIPPPNPNLLEIASLLRSGDLAGLDALAQRDPGAVGRFRDTSPDLAGALDRWVAARPDSAPARLARGNYWYEFGFHRRGGRVRGKTSEVQFADMRFALYFAESDYLRAIALDPMTGPAYARLLWIYTATSRKTDRDAIWKRALAAGAGSTDLHRALFNALLPWWSGLSDRESVARIRDFVAEIESGELQGTGDPELLRAFPDWAEAAILARAGHYDEALAKYQTFVDGPSGAFFLDDYAELLMRKRRSAEALSYFVAALRLDPAEPRVLTKYANALTRLKLYDQADDAFGRALSIDPYDPDPLLDRTAMYLKTGRRAEALADFGRAGSHGKEAAAYLANGGLLRLANEQDDLPAAAETYRKAIEGEPDAPAYHLYYAGALDKMRNCGAVPAYRRYVELCAGPGQCPEQMLRWVKVRSDSLVNRQVCSVDGYHLDPTIWLPTRSD